MSLRNVSLRNISQRNVSRQIVLPSKTNPGSQALRVALGLAVMCTIVSWSSARAQDLQPLTYRDPNLVVDLGVGLWAWPLPCDWDGDGDWDLVVVCPDKPFNGTYWFENTGRMDPDEPKMPIFQPPKRVARGMTNTQLSWVHERPVITTPETVYPDFLESQFEHPQSLGIERAEFHAPRVRANQWKLADLDADGREDLIVGVGDWNDYGWDEGFDAQGQWTRGPLHGYVYWLKQRGTLAEPDFAPAQRLSTPSGPVDVYGMPSPNLHDWDRDGDLDLICGEFLDGLTYFQNLGPPDEPRFAPGKRVQDPQGQVIRMDLQMIVPVAIDWDRDGDMDLVIGDEDGRVAWCEMLELDDQQTPRFAPPRYFKQVADRVKFGALVTPVSVDWDHDGDEDLICGNTAGYIGWVENLDGGNPPRWAAPRRLQVDHKPLRLQAGPNGSIQGPCEAKWGYTTLDVADWDQDGTWDLIVNSIWGKVLVFRGRRDDPLRVNPGEPIQVSWPGEPQVPAWNWWRPAADELVTQWRTTPTVLDWNRDGQPDLVMLDAEGYLAYFQRQHPLQASRVLPGQRIFVSPGPSQFDSAHRPMGDATGLLQLNHRRAGASGRRKLCWADWNRDGNLDLLVNSLNVDWFEGVPGEDGTYRLEPRGSLAANELAGHTTSPTVADWDGDGQPTLIVGAEDGFLYYLPDDAGPASDSSR